MLICHRISGLEKIEKNSIADKKSLGEEPTKKVMHV